MTQLMNIIVNVKKLFISPEKSIRRKLIIYFVIISSVPLLLLGISSYTKSTSLVNTQFGRYGEHAVEQMRLLMDERFQQMNVIAANVIAYLSDPTTAFLTGQAAANYNELQSENELLKVIKMSNHSFPSIISTSIITPSGKIYGSNLLQYHNLSKDQWWDNLDESKRQRYWRGFHIPDYYNPYTISPSETISLIIPLDETYRVPNGSKLLVDVKARPIIDIFHAFERETSAYLEVVDLDGNPIYQSDHTYQASDNDIIWIEHLETTGWQLKARLPFVIFNQSSNIILHNTIVFIGLAFAIAMVLAFIFSSLISQRLKLLNQSMLEFGLGRMTTKLEVASSDEIGQLEKRFNKMTEQIVALMHDIEKKEQAKKEAELKALHYQINPHLLFNTINSIQWKARLSGDHQVPAMLHHLTALLEDSLKISEALVTINKELQGINHYLEIQRLRYGNVFTYELTIEDGADQYLIPRMSLQPLFENIFFHGFTDGEGHIALHIVKRGNHLILTLKDDGEGFSMHLPPPDSKEMMERSNLGIQNVDDKFKLHFGEQYGLQIESEPDLGVTITILWPAISPDDSIGGQ